MDFQRLELNFISTTALELNIHTFIMFQQWLTQVGWEPVIEAILEMNSTEDKSSN